MDKAKPSERALSPLPYHREVVEHLKTRESGVWKWYSSAGHQEKYAETVRLDLLKSTYRLDRSAHEDIYAAVEEVSLKLGLSVPVTLYQAQTSIHHLQNAGIFCLPGEAHIVLQGDLMTMLSPAEIRALIGHELSHFLFYSLRNGDFAIATRILEAAAADPRCPSSFAETAHRFSRYTEIFADRGSLIACGDFDAAVACLVKISTGIRDVSPSAYVAQAEEVFSKGSVLDQGVTHPESFIRVRALNRWWEQHDDVDTVVHAMIEGQPEISSLDILTQVQVTQLTRSLLAHLMQPAWLRSEPVMAHARLYFNDFSIEHVDAAELGAKVKVLGATARDYVCYVLMDFAAADPVLDELPLVHVLELSDALEMRERLEELVNKELKITKKNLARLRKEGPELLQKAGAHT